MNRGIKMNRRIKVDKCAFNTFTGTYQSPIFADKRYEYKCPDPSCNEKVFLKKGEKNVPHFCHQKKSHCRRYETAMTESELHKEAKYLLQELIRRDYLIFFRRKCKGCLTQYECQNSCLKQCSKLNDNEKIIDEYSMDFNGGKIIADLANVSGDGSVNEIYEIYKSHRTLEPDRPSYINWYEIRADEICNKVSQIKEDKIIRLKCIRVWQCEECALADEKEKKRLQKIEQDEYNKKCQKKKEEELEKIEQENKNKIIELNQELKTLGRKHDGKANAYFINEPDIKKQKLQLDINTLIKMPQDEYTKLVTKYFPNYMYDGDYLKK